MKEHMHTSVQAVDDILNHIEETTMMCSSPRAGSQPLSLGFALASNARSFLISEAPPDMKVAYCRERSSHHPMATMDVHVETSPSRLYRTTVGS